MLSTVVALHPSLFTFTGGKIAHQHCLKMPLDVSWTAGFPCKPWHHQRAAVGQDLHLSQAKCHGGGFDLWSVDKQDKRSPSANLYASLPSLYQRRRHLLPLQGCSVLPCLATKTADSLPNPCLPSHSLSSSLSQPFTLPLTDVGHFCQNCWQESRVSVSFSHSWKRWKDGGSDGRREG